LTFQIVNGTIMSMVVPCPSVRLIHTRLIRVIPLVSIWSVLSAQRNGASKITEILRPRMYPYKDNSVVYHLRRKIDMAIDDINGWMEDRILDENDRAEFREFMHNIDKEIADVKDEYNGFKASSEAKYDELNTSISNLTSENKSLKAKNYELLMSLPSNDDNEGGNSFGVPNYVQSDGEVIHTIDSLFVNNREK